MLKVSLVERIVFKNASVHDCGGFAVVVTCNGESDFSCALSVAKAYLDLSKVLKIPIPKYVVVLKYIQRA